MANATTVYRPLPPVHRPCPASQSGRGFAIRDCTTLDHPGCRLNYVPHHAELGITLASARRWAEAKTELERGLALPTAWVTDDYYRGLARTKLVWVQGHLE